MGNISSIILSHNKNILKSVSDTEYCCNCRFKESCPLQNKCLTNKIVYRADVKNPTNNEKKKHPLNNVSEFKHLKTEIALSYQNI